MLKSPLAVSVSNFKQKCTAWRYGCRNICVRCACLDTGLQEILRSCVVRRKFIFVLLEIPIWIFTLSTLILLLNQTTYLKCCFQSMKTAVRFGIKASCVKLMWVWTCHQHLAKQGLKPSIKKAVPQNLSAGVWVSLAASLTLRNKTMSRMATLLIGRHTGTRKYSN